MKEIMEIIKSLKNRGILLKGTTTKIISQETIKNETKEKKEDLKVH